MYSNNSTFVSTANYLDNIQKLKYEINHADAILIGAGAGLSTSAGLTYDGERFYNIFGDFNKKYGMTDMYSGGFYPFETLEEHWAWWSRQIYYNRYDVPPNTLYHNILELVKDKNYFVLTTNVDHMFQNNGFDKNKLFYMQGDYGLFQCIDGCDGKTYDNEKQIRQMVKEQQVMKIPTELIPRCPVCGKPMVMNLRCDDSFVQDEGWYKAYSQYEKFLANNKNSHILLLELGVGHNTPGIIKYPFWKIARLNENAIYACINKTDTGIPEKIVKQAICINEDIAKVITDLLN